MNLVTSWSGVAPIERAASKIPFPVSNSEFSNNLVRSGIAFTVSGTIAAVGPILVPIINFVTGIIATRSTTNGVLRTMFLITLIMFYTPAFGYRPPFLVNIRTTARINAITVAIISDIPTMYSVSANDVSSFSFDIPRKFSSAIFFPSF